MAFTYTGPAESDRDLVRFLIQDTDSTDALFQDAELDYLLETEGSALKAAARACEVLIAKFAQWNDESVGGVRVSFSQRADSYRKLMADLKRRIAMRSAVPYAGGISRADKDANIQDSDRVAPMFTRNLHDLPNSVEDSEGEERGDQ
jgi:hypothetical protein